MKKPKHLMKCEHCGKSFPALGGTKYCDTCKKEIRDKRSSDYREKHKYLKAKSITELLEKSKPFRNIVTCFEEKIKKNYLSLKDKERISWLKYHLDVLQDRSLGFTHRELLNASKLSKSHFETFLKTCLKLEALEHRDTGYFLTSSGYFLTSKNIYEPLKTRYKEIIDETPNERTYPEEHFFFCLPKNMVLNDFERDDRIQINKTVDDFFISMRENLKNVRKRKARKIWTREVNNSSAVNPLVKLDVWVTLFMNHVCAHSPKIFLSFDTKILDTASGMVSREKAIEIWKKQSGILAQEIYNDILNYRWQGENLSDKQEKQINLQFNRESKKCYLHCDEVWKKIVETLQAKNYTLVISPFIERGFGYTKEKGEIDENIEYLKSLPWFEYEPSKADDKLMDALNYVLSIEKKYDLIKRKEVESAGIKTVWEYKVTEEEKGGKKKRKDVPIELPVDDLPYSILGNKFFDFCKDLGYKNRVHVSEMIADFESVFLLPDIPNPRELLKK